MRTLIITVAGLLVMWAMSGSTVTQDTMTFQAFVQKYRKSYFTTAEYNHRRAIFYENLKHLSDIQSASSTAMYGVTCFSDWTHEEFQRFLTLIPAGQIYEPNTPEIVFK